MIVSERLLKPIVRELINLVHVKCVPRSVRGQYLGKGSHLATRLNGSGCVVDSVYLAVAERLNDDPYGLLLDVLHGVELVCVHEIVEPVPEAI